MAKGGSPRPMTCGDCGGQGKTYHQTGRYRTETVGGKKIEVEIVEERTCSRCGGKGTV